MKFAVIGGDMRHAKLAELLSADGHDVFTFAIDKIRLEGVTQTGLARDATNGAACVVFPLPMTSREGLLSTPLSSGLHTTREVLSVIAPGQAVCAGRVDGASRELAEQLGVTLTDYLEREEFAVANAAAAAEGAVQLIMEETPITLCGASILVIGFGRISKILCNRLRGLGSIVSASARSFTDLAWIRAYGYIPCMTDGLDGTLGGYDVIVNTVPARVMSENRLAEVKSGCLCLDLASKPGGIDFSAASRIGVKAMWALSLPGEVAPVTSGAIIRDTVYNVLREGGAAL